MAVNRYAGLKGLILLATALSATLGGCASVDYTKVAEQKRLHQVVPMPRAATETAYAMPGAPVSGVAVKGLAAAPVQTAALPAVGTAGVAPRAPDPALVALAAATAPGGVAPVGTQPMVSGQPVLMQPIIGASASANPLTPSNTTAGPELAYAAPALVALPQPRPDIIEAANTLPNIPTPLEEAAAAAAATQVKPQSSAEKDVQLLEQRLASAEPAPGDLNPLMTTDIAIPTPRPDNQGQSLGLEAYAQTPSMLALDGFDTSGPKQLDQLDETGPTLAPSARLQGLIHKYAMLYQVPEALVQRVVRRESTYNPRAYHSGNYGLMQIRYNTARSLGYNGPPSGLFDAETNLKYAVKYLRGAFMVAENNHDNAVRLYARGYYYDAKRKGLLAQIQ